MKKKIIAFVLATFTTLGSLSLTNGTIAKAKSFSEIYQSTYDCVVRLKEIGGKYQITPRLKNNGTTMRNNNLADVALSSKLMQKAIDQLRIYQHQFPNEYWKARNTFSEIGDSYQQPIYEWIVDIAVNLPKEIKKLDFKDPIDTFNMLNHLEEKANHANVLNEGVDPAYKFAYQAAIDELIKEIHDTREKFKLATGWIKKDNKFYYYDKGKKLTGWQFVNGGYYFNEDSSIKTGWHSQVNPENKKTFWYYLKPSSGEGASGWTKIDDKDYFFNTEIGDLETKGWVGVYYSDSGLLSEMTLRKPYTPEYLDYRYYYYIDKPGSVLKGKHTIDGVTYDFDENGIFVKN